MPKYKVKNNFKYSTNVNCCQANLEKEEKNGKRKLAAVTLTSLYRYNTKSDNVLMFLAFFFSIGIGVAVPLNILIFKSVINLLVKPPGASTTYFKSLLEYVIQFGILAACAFVAGFIQCVCQSLLSERIEKRYKHELYQGLLRQDIKWFDSQQTGRLITHMTDDVETIVTAIFNKTISFVQQVSTFISSILIAFISDWKLTLISLSCLPLLLLVFIFLIRFIKKFAIAQIQAYTTAGGIAEEILSGMKTVVSCNAQQSEVKRYSVNLIIAEKLGIKKGICQGVAGGCIGLIVWSVASLTFYMGLKFFKEGTIDPGGIILVFFNVVLGSIAIGNAIPQIENIIQAKAAGYPIFQIIDNKPEIDIREPGITPDSFSGDITFSNVTFEYPSRPGVTIIKDFSFTIPHGKTVAFIGPSGSGKSTVIHLLQRFYDPDKGTVTMGTNDLKSLNLKWYRSHVGVVQQEPPLFKGTIEENIRLGKVDATQEEIVEASKQANAFDFITETKLQFQTLLGDSGSGFSGGQKQRIAIATALIRKPSLLLLDEATSALDRESERLVQSTIDTNISGGKSGMEITVIMVAHRLQTVRNADIIVVMKDGVIVEQGNHHQLLEKQGLYYSMLMKQNEGDVKEENKEEDEKIIDVLEESAAIESSKRYPSRPSVEHAMIKPKVTKHQALKDFFHLMRLNNPEMCYIIVGVVSSIITGVVFPFAAIIYSQMFQIFTYLYTDPPRYDREGNLFCGLILIPGCVLFVFQILKNTAFAISGEALTTRLREMMLASILNQEMAWFDEPLNQPGILVGRLASEASLVKGAAGLQMGIFIESGSNLLAAFFIGFYYSWQLALLFFALIPMVTVSGIIQGRNISGSQVSDNSGVSGGPIALVLETLNNVRRVKSLNLQQHFTLKHYGMLCNTSKKKYLKLFLYGLFGAVGTSAQYIGYCCIFLLGGYLLDRNLITMLELMRVLACLNMSSSSLGRALALSPDFEKARLSTRKTLDTIDRVSDIDPSSDEGIIPESRKLFGHIVLTNVRFRYPTRPNIPVLKKFSYEIKQQTSVALVGHSGCGKSTIIQLLLRFYDAFQIKDDKKANSPAPITVDGYDITKLNLRWLRSQIGLVQQEPVLFNISVQDNIILGVEAPLDEARVKEVAVMANIDAFVSNLPEGYLTKVGQRGGHLSGGQKQRICIARALYRQPNLLLLDEATSALDTESESVVQAALVQATKGRTSVSIAHRLSSIRDYVTDIVVVDHGKVVEKGSHEELMAIPHGRYRGLYSDSAE